MKRFCKTSAPVIVAAIMIFVSAVPVFAEGLTTSQATSIYTELTSLSGNYIKSFLYNIQRSLTATASTGVLYELQRISASLRGSGNDGHPAQLWGLLDRALYGNHDLLGSGWQGIGYYVHKIATEGFALESAISDKLSFNDSSIAELVSRLGDVSFTPLANVGASIKQNGAYLPAILQPLSAYQPLIITTPSWNPNVISVVSDSAAPSTIGDWFNILNTNLVQSTFRIYSKSEVFNAHKYDYDTFVNKPYAVNSVMNMLDISFESIGNSVGRLSAFFVDEDELQAKKDNKDVIEGAVQGFLSPGESASVSASGVVELKGNFDALQNGFGSSAAASDSFSVLSSGSETYSWFSQTTANDLDSVEPGSTLRALGSDTPALDQYYQDVLFGIHYFD